MSQADIIDVLERTKKPLSRSEIAKLLNENPRLTSSNLKELLEHKEIKFKEIDRTVAFVMFNSKRRLRLYYI